VKPIKTLIPFLFSLLLVSCASIDKGMMATSEAISSEDPVTGERQLSLMTEEKEIKRAEEITQKILAKAQAEKIKIDNETPYMARVNEVFQRLISVVHRKHLPWEIHVIDDPKNWNAFTVGGGKVFLFTGIFTGDVALQNNDELAAVIAHEMAHVAARHASEKTGKTALMKLADKRLRTSEFDASFTTVQEDEADKYSVVYSALAGYDPTAGIKIWSRMHEKYGSFSNILHDHPLNDDRAGNITKYAGSAKKYLLPHQINQDHEKILENNELFSKKKSNELKAGEGAGFLALLETAANSYKEAMDARLEESKRKLKQIEQERIASGMLLFKNIKINSAVGGGKGIFGIAINNSSSAIINSKIVIEYFSRNILLDSENISWDTMAPYEQKQFGLKLKPINYTSVRLRPIYVQLREAEDGQEVSAQQTH